MTGKSDLSWGMRLPCLIMLLMMPGAPLALAEDQQACEARLLTAGFGSGFLKDFCPGEKLCIVVNEAVWDKVDYKTKLGLAKTVDCAIAGPGKSLIKFLFRSDRTNKVLGTWTWGKLTVE